MAAVWRSDLRLLMRLRWLLAVAAAGVLIAVVIVADVAGAHGDALHDPLRSHTASLLLLGGLVVAVGLGSGAFAADASRGYLGLLVGNGITPSHLGLGRVLARHTVLVAVIAAWTATVEVVSVVVGAGFDGDLMVHALTVLVNLMLVLGAAAAMASVIGPMAAGAFGVMVYVSAQAAVNLKAALDQHAISDGSNAFITGMYVLFPRALVSPMISLMQLRDVAGPAAPRVDVNGMPVLVPESTWPTVLWTLAWVAAVTAVAAYGVRRRQL